MNSSREIPTVELGGVTISRLTFQRTLNWIEKRLSGKAFTQVATANMDFLHLCSTQPELKEILNDKCDLVTADGMPLVWLSRAAGRPLPERVTGSDLVPEIVRLASKLGLRIFFLGGDADVTPAAVRKLCAQTPRLRFAGMNCSRFNHRDEKKVAAIAAEIRASKADVLFVALGCPKQEHFISQNRERLGVRFAIGVGGTFDFLAGARCRAPQWMQRAGLEWAYRMAQEPRRLAPRYVRNLTCFAQLAWNVRAIRA